MDFRTTSGSKYTLNVNTKVNTSQIIKQLSELEKVSVVNIKAKFDGQDAIKQITTYKDAEGKLIQTQQLFDKNLQQLRNHLGQFAKESQEVIVKVKDNTNAFGKLRTETETNVSSTGRLVTRTKEYKDNVLQCVNVVQQYKDAQGQLVTETQKLDASGHKLGTTQKQIVADTKTVTTEINKYIDAQGREITQTTKLNAQRDGEVERIIKVKTAEGGLITTTEKVKISKGQEIDSTRESTQVIERNTQVTKENADSKDELSSSIKNQNGAVNDFVSTMGKVIKFQIITKIITGFTTACREAINVVKEFDTQLTEMKKVSDYSGDSLETYTKQLGELGTAVARTRTQMVEGATQFIKSGYDEETAGQLAQISALFQNIADSELSAGQSATFIISQMKAFRTELEQLGDEGTQATYVIDSINEVSNNMAVSSTDISTALSKTASAMSALGNNYNETIALVTSG